MNAAWKILALASLACLGSACLVPSSVICSDGRLCPSGTRCGTPEQGCITSTEEAACMGHGEGDDCSLVGAPGKCHDKICLPFKCGDNVRNGAESCDGPDLNKLTCASYGFYEPTGLTCNADCTLQTIGCRGYCGDGIRNGVEDCDGADFDGQTCMTAGFNAQTTGLACSDQCTLITTGCVGNCGDLKVDRPETCDGPPTDHTCVDLGYDQGFIGCSTACGILLDDCSRFDAWPSTPLAGASTGPTLLGGVWGSDVGNVFAVGGTVGGGGVILHSSDQATRSAVAPIPMADELTRIWGSGPKDIFVLGGRLIAHWDGTEWSLDRYNESLNAISGSSSTNVYAVSGGGSILQWNGSAWRAVTRTTDKWSSVWVGGLDDVYAGSTGGVISHWNGSAWKPALKATGESITGIWGSGPDDVYAVSQGSSGTKTMSTIRHWDGTAWRVSSAQDQNPLNGVAGHARNDVYVFGDAGVDHWDGARWSRVKSSTGIRALWAGAGEVFAVGTSIWHWAGTRWGARDATLPAFNAIWAAGAQDAFAVGDGHVIGHWNGTSWSTATVADAKAPAGNLTGVSGTCPNDVLAVGAGGTILHFDGNGWSPMDSGTSVDLQSVWSSGARDAFVVGGTGEGSPPTILRFDGAGWSPMTTDVVGKLVKVWGSGPDDVYAVGPAVYAPAMDGLEATMLHWDGQRWSQMAPPGSTDDVWGSGAAAVYLVGAYPTAEFPGSIERGNVAGWKNLVTGPYLSTMSPLQNFRFVAGSGAGDVFVAGDDFLFHGRDATWERIALPPAATRIRGVAVTPSRVFIVGDMGEAHLDRPSVTCVGPEQSCGDGWDNDCDGRADAADPDCAPKVAEQCANGVDDDGDGSADCDDGQCASFPSCRKR